MSPEQAEGKPLDQASDVFSFGTMLYELATGRRPFDGGSNFAVMAAIVSQHPPAPTRVNPACRRRSNRSFCGCCRRSARRRPTASEIETELSALGDRGVGRRRLRGGDRAADDRRARGGAADAARRLHAGGARGEPVHHRDRRARDGQDRAGRGLPRRARRQPAPAGHRARSIVGAAGRVRGLPAGARGAREPDASAAAASRSPS